MLFPETCFFTRGLFLEIEMSITFLYDQQFEPMTPFSKEEMDLQNSASATFYKLSWQMLFPESCFLQEDFTLKLKLA